MSNAADKKGQRRTYGSPSFVPLRPTLQENASVQSAQYLSAMLPSDDGSSPPKKDGINSPHDVSGTAAVDVAALVQKVKSGFCGAKCCAEVSQLHSTKRKRGEYTYDWR